VKLNVSVVVLALALAGCGREELPNGSSKSEPVHATPRSAGVELSETAMRNAGITVDTVRAEPVRESISATGQLTVNEEQTWIVGALHDGRIVSVDVTVGDTVKQGQVLAQMHSQDLHESRAAYKRAVAEVTRAESAEAQAQRMHERARRLFDLKALSQQEVELAALQLRNAQTAVQNARIEVERERAHLVEFLDVPVEQIKEEDFVPIKAPASGVVIDRKGTPGTVVAMGQEVFRITTPTSIWMLANVNEANLSDLRVGQPVKVLVRAYPDRAFDGRILRLGEALDPTTRTLQVRVLVPNPGGMLKPQMYASAEIGRSSTRQSVFVPDAAVQDLSGNRIVFVETGDRRFEPRPVRVGRSVEGRTEILEGLTPGNRIATKGSFVLKSEFLRSSIEEE
jgi:cobalt-zinc-cadmium efflux system membrane fusion protein